MQITSKTDLTNAYSRMHTFRRGNSHPFGLYSHPAYQALVEQAEAGRVTNRMIVDKQFLGSGFSTTEILKTLEEIRNN